MSERYSTIQEQTQQLKQGQIISRQQLLQASLVELPVMQLVDRINIEMNDNPALEVAAPGDEDYQDSADFQDYSDTSDTADDFETSSEREDRQSALDEALSGIGRDDEDLPVYQGGSAMTEEREEMVFGQTTSFYDQLKEQMGELDGEKTGVASIFGIEEYKRLAAVEDIAPYLCDYSPFPEDELKIFFGEKLAPAILEENRVDCLSAVKTENIAAAWQTIRELIRALPESEQMRESFLQLHAKHTWEEIGVSREDKDVILKYSPMVRNRLTLMRMKRMFPTL